MRCYKVKRDSGLGNAAGEPGLADDSDLSTEEILEAFRAKREKKVQGTPSGSDDPGSPGDPDDRGAPDGSEAPDDAEDSGDDDADAATDPAEHAGDDDAPAPHSEDPRPTPEAPEAEATPSRSGPTRRDRPGAVIDGDAEERPKHPVLADEVRAVEGRLEERGWRKGQYLGAGVLFGGLLLLLFERYLAWYGAGPARMGPVPVWPFLLFVAVAGAAALATFIYYPGARRVEVERDLGKTLRDVTDALVLARWMQWGGLGGAAFGFLVPLLIGLFATPPAALTAIFLTIGVAGATAWLVGALRSPDLRRLGVQSAAYAHWQAKEGGLDPVRIARVLAALDGLLGQLPDSAVHRFLETREADEYMALLEETVGTPGSSED